MSKVANEFFYGNTAPAESLRRAAYAVAGTDIGEIARLEYNDHRAGIVKIKTTADRMIEIDLYDIPPDETADLRQILFDLDLLDEETRSFAE